MDRSVSVSVGVVFGLTLPALSSGMEDESPLRVGSKPAARQKAAVTGGPILKTKLSCGETLQHHYRLKQQAGKCNQF